MKKLLPLLKEILGVILFIIWILFFGFSIVFFQENQSCIPVPIVIFSLVILWYLDEKDLNYTVTVIAFTPALAAFLANAGIGFFSLFFTVLLTPFFKKWVFKIKHFLQRIVGLFRNKFFLI